MKEFTALFGFPILLVGAVFVLLAGISAARGWSDDFFARLGGEKPGAEPPDQNFKNYRK